MMKKKIISILLPIIVITAVMVFAINRPASTTYQRDSGLVFGTSYNITYESETNYKDSIKAVMDHVDRSLSPFNKESIITAVNNNKDVTLDDFFTEVYTLATRISQSTGGAFDITVAPLVNAWGFGFKGGEFPSDKTIDSLRTFVGMEKVTLANGKIIKKDQRTMLDCSAIAKGYAVDKVADFLRSKGITNFLVEIGGEIVAQGQNPKGKQWSIGITKPEDDSLAVNSELSDVIQVTDIAMATSGNYRNYYIYKGKKYSHTIDPHTGYPARQNILSATVMASTCATADAYATAFMTMGFDKTIEFLKTSPEGKKLSVYLIYMHDGKMREYASPKYKQ